MGYQHEQPLADATHPAYRPSAGRGALALLLLLPAPTIGVVFAMHLYPDTTLGKSVHLSAKLWLLALPIAWLVLVERVRPRLPRWSWQGMAAGLITGLLTMGVIVGAWELFAHRMVDAEFFKQKMHDIGLGTKLNYLAFAAGVTFINALLEEYVWRWFVYSKWRDVLGGMFERWGGRLARRSSEARNQSVRDSVVMAGGTPIPPGATSSSAKAIVIPGAIALAGAFFVLHHSVAMAVYFDWHVNALASLGIFIGHVTWAVIYFRYKNIYAAYVSHVFADIGLFIVGYQIAFGA